MASRCLRNKGVGDTAIEQDVVAAGRGGRREMAGDGGVGGVR
jgi:hypothetical protein